MKTVEISLSRYRQARWQASYLDEKEPAGKLYQYLLSRKLEYSPPDEYSDYTPESNDIDLSSEISLEVLKHILDDHPELKCPPKINEQPLLSFILSSQVTPWNKCCDIIDYLLKRDKLQPDLATIEYAHSIQDKFIDSNAKLLAIRLIQNLLSYAEPTVRVEFLNKYPKYNLAPETNREPGQPTLFTTPVEPLSSQVVQPTDSNKPKQR